MTDAPSNPWRPWTKRFGTAAAVAFAVTALLVLGPQLTFGAYGSAALFSPAFTSDATLIIAFATFVVTAIGTILTAWFAWRADRRQAAELALKQRQAAGRHKGG